MDDITGDLRRALEERNRQQVFMVRMHGARQQFPRQVSVMFGDYLTVFPFGASPPEPSPPARPTLTLVP